MCLIVAELQKTAKIDQKRQFYKFTLGKGHTMAWACQPPRNKLAPCICRNSIYVAPPCEWILNTLPQTARSTEDQRCGVLNFGVIPTPGSKFGLRLQDSGRRLGSGLSGGWTPEPPPLPKRVSLLDDPSSTTCYLSRKKQDLTQRIH